MLEAHYPTDTLYPTRYFRELSPAWLNYVARLDGAPAPALNKPFRYLELGCGTGLSGAIHAAAFPQAEFHLCDFNAGCIAAAQQHARQLGAANVTWLARRFSDLARCQLPTFDYVVLHGVWTWVNPAEQRAILDLLAQRLRPGGLAYVSYNCLPGWASEMPLVHLAQCLADVTSGSSDQRLSRVLELLAQLSNGGIRYFAQSPGAREAVSAWTHGDADYLVHELLSADWQPRYAHAVHRQMADAGLHFLGSATLADNHPELQTDAQTGALAMGLPTAELRTLAMDFAANRRFRRDVFIRKDPSIPHCTKHDGDHLEMADVILGTLHPALDPNAVMPVPRGRLHFDEGFIRATSQLLAQGPRPLTELVARLAGADHDRRQVTRNLHYALAGGLLAPCARTGAPCRDAPHAFTTAAVGRCLRQAVAQDHVVWVPSPVTGGGVPLRRRDAVQLLHALAGRCRDDARPLLRHFQQLELLR